MKNEVINFLDLFSGVGGFRYSIEKVCKNANCVGYSEIDKFALLTYKSNFKIKSTELELGDINNIDIKTIPNFDILFAGFPCQPFSLMGKNKGFNDIRGTLFFSIEKILNIKKPKLFLLENVRGLLKNNNGETYKTIIKKLEKIGYYTLTFVLNSKYYGVPQNRRRVYILGFLDKKLRDSISIPKKINSKLTTWHLLEKEVDEKYYLSEKILKTILADGSGKFKSKSEINPIIARPLTATMHKMHRACQDNYFSDSFILGNFNNQNKSVTKKNLGINRIRKITPLEAFRLQGYSDVFVKNAYKNKISNTQLYKQAGNSITINVVESILKEILSKY